MHPTYCEIDQDVYKIITPTLSAHNLLVGTPYLDIGDTASVTKLVNKKEVMKFEIKFYRREWFSRAKDFCTSAKLINDKGVELGATINGKWSESFSASFSKE